MKKTYKLEGMDCAHCALLLQDEIGKTEGVQDALIDFAAGKLRVRSSLPEGELTDKIRACVAANDPDVQVYEEDQVPQEEKSRWREWIHPVVALLLFVIALFLKNELFKGILCAAAWAIAGWKTAWQALRNLIRGKLMDETLLMTIATIGAFAIGDFPEAAAVMIFFHFGELVQEKAVDRSRKLIAALMDIKPDHANVIRETGILIVPPEDVQVGEHIFVKPGERIPLDGVITTGNTLLDLSALNGESLPREAGRGDQVLSGAINTTGVIEIRVEKSYDDSTVARILDLVENASARKARTERFITRFSRWYTPLVVGSAAALAIFMPLFTADPFALWLQRALVFLVVSCPCALVVSIPLSFSAGIGAASRMGVLVKGGTALEALAKADTIALDKTGTLTKGVFEINDLLPEAGFTQDELLFYAAQAEHGSTHPIAKAIAAACDKRSEVTDLRESAGMGVTARVDGHSVCVGKALLAGAPEEQAGNETTVFVSVDGRYAGRIGLKDMLKEGSTEAVKGFKKQGIRRVVLLTGDAQQPAEAVGREIGADEVAHSLLPQDKVIHVEEWMQRTKGGLIFVGDGINDAPVIARSDVGVAMGGIGSDAAIEAADIVLMRDDLNALARAIGLSHKTRRILFENIAFALGVKIAVLVLSALGLTGMWLAVFADVGVALLAILNAARLLDKKDSK